MVRYDGTFLNHGIVKISSHYLGGAESNEGRLHLWPCPRCKVGEFRADGDAGTAGCTGEGCGLSGSVDAVQTIARFEGLDSNTHLRDVLRKGKQILDAAAETASRGGAVEGPVGQETAGVTGEPAPDSQQGQPETSASPESTPEHDTYAMLEGQLRSPDEVRQIIKEQDEQRVRERIRAEVEKAKEGWWQELEAQERDAIKLNDQSVKRVLEAYSWMTPVELLLAVLCLWVVFLLSYWLLGGVDDLFVFVLELIGISQPEAAPGQQTSLWDGIVPFLWEHGRALISTVPGFCGAFYAWRELSRERRRKARLQSKQYVAILKPRRRKG